MRQAVERSARIGVHIWSGNGSVSGDMLPRDHPEHKLYLNYYRDIGIDEDFYWFTLQASPQKEGH